MFLKFFHRWPSILLLLLVPGMATAHQGGDKKPPTINWQTCYRESGLPFLCGSVDVPLDYNAPKGEKLTLALIKLPATVRRGRKVGSLFFNPGGPGNSGVDFVLGAGPFLPPNIREHFDVIGFDPRGIGRSSPLVCFNAPVAVPPFFFPRNPAEEALWADFDRTMAGACKANGGPVLDHMSTANVARDLDLLRQAVGDSQLNYVGYSYGSFLGITYANLFPNKIRAMVLDGVVDPIAYTTGYGNEGYNLPVTTRLPRDEGAQATLNEFLRLCDQAGVAQCPFGNAAASNFDFLVDHLRTTPVHIIHPIFGPVDLTYDRFIEMVFSALVHSSGWPLLANVLNEIHATIITGSEGAAIRAGIAFAALFAALGDVPSPDDKALAAQQFAVMCSDSINPDNYAAWSLAGEAAEANDGVFGRLTAWQSSPCAVWQGNDPDRYLGPFTRKSSRPILLVANRFDPLTPYEGALQTHGLLPNSALLTLEGWGHTSLFLSSCVDQAVSNYLLTSKIPGAGASCQQDVAPFADTLAEPTSSGNIASQAANPEPALKDDKVDARQQMMQSILGHKSRTECLLDWAERNYSNLFSPAGAKSQFQSPYTYRYYSQANSYVGVSASDNHVYYLGPERVLVDVGDLYGWLTKASCL
ncbi:MAG: alpha/beta hydrolase [Methylomicrobium sp.]